MEGRGESSVFVVNEKCVDWESWKVGNEFFTTKKKVFVLRDEAL